MKKFTLLGLIFFLIHCGSTTDTQQNPDDSISIPDGYAIYGTVDAEAVQIEEDETETNINLYDDNDNQTLDSGEAILFEQNNYSHATSDDIQISLILQVADFLSLPLNTLQNLPVTAGDHIAIQFPGTNVQSKQATAVAMYLTSSSTTAINVISGFLQVTLSGGSGSLTFKFSGYFSYSTVQNP